VSGCYITIPIMFHDPDLGLDCAAIQRHVRFLRGHGVAADNAVLLAGGTAGDFSTTAFDERMRVAAAVREAADGAIPHAMGAQTTSTRKLVRLARAAESLGYGFIQVSCPFYSVCRACCQLRCESPSSRDPKTHGTTFQCHASKAQRGTL
jgi:dihydrodipicolinate synthase/N-acetylneuraminate lyase